MINVIRPSYQILTDTTGILEHLELCGRVCYKSEDKITKGSASNFIKKLIKSGHESVLEHASITVKIICDRACSHQLVRHRLCSFSQESQRYCNYGKKGFTFIGPDYVEPGVYETSRSWIYKDNAIMSYGPREGKWLFNRFGDCEEYNELLKVEKPEEARCCLPNCTKTEVIVTANIRQWRHIFKERAFNKHAQNQIRQLMLGLCMELPPELFGDLYEI